MTFVLPPAAHDYIRALHAYWDARRGSRPMPARRDLDPPLDLPGLLPHLFLVDVATSGAPLTYRLFGTGLVRLFGRDLTGRTVGDGTLADHLTEVQTRYARVIASRTPFYHRARLYERTNDYARVERLILPLSADGHAVDMLLGMTVREDEGL